MKRFSDTEIETLKSLHKGGATQTELAREYGVSRTTVQNYLKGYHIANIKRKRLADLNEREWNIMAKENHKKLSSRPDAVTAIEESLGERLEGWLDV